MNKKIKNKIYNILDTFTLLNYGYILFTKLKAKCSSFFISDELKISKKFFNTYGFRPNLKNPQTLNEKINWLKINDRRDINSIVADKYRVRNFYKEKIKKDYFIPLLYKTKKIKDINSRNINKFPCIVKCNNGSGTWEIIKNANEVNFHKLRNKCRRWKHLNHYYVTQEWQYKNIKPLFIVEKLLQTSEGKIPNDYKLHYFNGELQFIYCSIDREGGNFRCCYDKNWKKLEFTWVEKGKHDNNLNSVDIERPKTLDEMIRIGNEISVNWDYVRVDFFDCDGKLYYGEITLHHGSGNDVFTPQKYDLIYGQRLTLSKKR